MAGANSGCDTTGAVAASLWENGGSIVDLNTLIPPNGMQLVIAGSINERGEIAGLGVLPNGDTHAFVLIPCGNDDDGCGDDAEGSTATTQNRPGPVTQGPSTATPANPAFRGMLERLHARRFPWYQVPGPGTGPTN